MENEKANRLLYKFKKVIPRGQSLLLKEKLELASEEVLDRLSNIELISPNLTLFFSIFLGWIGTDRFYIGDVALGICKIFFNVLTLGIWGFVDVFLTCKKAREINLENIMLAL